MSIADKLITIAENVQKTYDAGYNKGKSEGNNYQLGYNEGYTEGYNIGNTEGYQDGYEAGALPMYYIKDGGFLFNQVIFPTNTSMVLRTKAPTGLSSTFMRCSNLVQLKLIVEDECSIDMSACIREAKDLEILDLSECNVKPTKLSWFALSAPKLKTILGAFDFSNCTAAQSWIGGASLLETISFVPETINMTLDMSQNQKLTKDSLSSAIGGLISSAVDLTISFSKIAVNKAFETAEGLNDGSTSTEWTILANTKSNWTITLV